jgi:hypothetical protein
MGYFIVCPWLWIYLLFSHNETEVMCFRQECHWNNVVFSSVSEQLCTMSMCYHLVSGRCFLRRQRTRLDSMKTHHLCLRRQVLKLGLQTPQSYSLFQPQWPWVITIPPAWPSIIAIKWKQSRWEMWLTQPTRIAASETCATVLWQTLWPLHASWLQQPPPWPGSCQNCGVGSGRKGREGREGVREWGSSEHLRWGDKYSSGSH